MNKCVLVVNPRGVLLAMKDDVLESRAVLSRARVGAQGEFFRHGSFVFAGTAIANVFQYAYYAAVGRIVGVVDYGVVTSLLSATLMVAAPASVAATIVARLAAEFSASGDDARLRSLVRIVNRWTLLAAAALLALVALLRDGIAGFFHAGSIGAVVAAGVALALTAAMPVQRAVFSGAQAFGAYAASNVIEAVCKAVAGAALALRFGADGALAGAAVALAAAYAYNVLTLRARHGGPAGRLALNRSTLTRTSAAIAGATLSVTTLTSFDVVLVKHYFSAVDAGLFAAAALAGRAIYALIAFLPTVVLPKAVGGSRDAAPRLFAAAFGTAAVIAAVATVVCRLDAPLVLSIVAGRAFVAAAPLLVPYAFALSCLALANVTVAYNIGLERYRFVTPLAVIAVAEIGTVIAYHPSIGAVLAVIVAGHGLALLATLAGVFQREKPLAAGTATPS
ncbi:MAG: hypothetical protein ABR591_13005 [Candidatus Velthaea sp.]